MKKDSIILNKTSSLKHNWSKITFANSFSASSLIWKMCLIWKNYVFLDSFQELCKSNWAWFILVKLLVYRCKIQPWMTTQKNKNKIKINISLNIHVNDVVATVLDWSCWLHPSWFSAVLIYKTYKRNVKDKT